MTTTKLATLAVAAGLAMPLTAVAQGQPVPSSPGFVPNAPGAQVVTPSTPGLIGSNQELVDLQLRLLNEFGGLGFAAMRNFQKVGSMYTAEVMLPDGTWVEIVLDPQTGVLARPAG